MDSKTALNIPEYMPPQFPVSPRVYHGSSRGYWSAIAAVFTAAVLACGLIAAAIIFRSGGYPVTTCPPGGDQVAQPMAMSGNKVKRVDLTTAKGDHLTEVFDYDRQSNTVLIDAPANITESSVAATIAVDLDRSVMFIGSHDSNTCVGLAIDVDFTHQVRDYVEENDQNVIDISNVAINIEKYRLLGQIPVDYFQATNGPVIRGLCSGRITFWALPVAAEEYGRLRRDFHDCPNHPCFCLPYLPCICECF
ncbi:uncharacterized protein LOC105437449 [Strongylocentrotus purpuratus]|uniref:Uncharacterized protein n=1 Tax=Strongylocentrotus purpuratus TaxID=7668 RepID=A0A7M7HIN9_STRPU|nr:uncharacterized protein LOC105437449 [Strongylocentrotus purpuratus]|eukprot:XP_011662348.1 PREDICTED: uncharacterized protein LOC105437449 [Strongylocentrotus purpuratus]